MPAEEKICIVVPCYNEGSRLDTDVFNTFITQHACINFLFVDDGSSDNTGEILSSLCRDSTRMSSVRLEKNSGKALAVRYGMLQSIGHDYDLVGYWDADLSTPLEEIPRLQKEFSKPDIDIVMGSRVKILGHKIERKLVRHLAGRIFATAASITLKLPVYDTQCGAKLFRNNSKLHVALEKAWISNWAFDVEFIQRYLLIHYENRLAGEPLFLTEVPLKQWRDTAGSKVKAIDLFTSLYDLLKIYRFYAKQANIQQYSNHESQHTKQANRP